MDSGKIQNQKDFTIQELKEDQKSLKKAKNSSKKSS